MLAFFPLTACGQAADHQPPAQTSSFSLSVDTLASGLEVPWAIAFLPNGDMLFSERKGSLRKIREGELLSEEITGVPEVKARGQGGFFDIQLHPNYEENGWIYFTFASPGKEGEEGSGANTELIRAKLDGMSLTNVESLFKASPNYGKGHHFGGRIAFDQDGYLFLSVGDRA